MVALYSLIQGDYKDETVGKYHSYGISLNAGQALRQVEDVTLSRELLLNAVTAWNSLQLSALHFEEALEDLLAE